MVQTKENLVGKKRFENEIELREAEKDFIRTEFGLNETILQSCFEVHSLSL